MPHFAIFTALMLLAVPAFAAPAASFTPTPTPPADPKATPTFVVNKVPGVTPNPNVHPEPVYSAWPHIDLYEAERLHTDKRNLFVDARAKAEWDASHIPRAIPLPLGEFDAYYKQHKKKIDKAKVLVVYCHGGGCHLSEKECQKFIDHGHRNVVCFHDGWPGWHNAKLPEEDAAGKISYPPATLTPTPAP